MNTPHEPRAEFIQRLEERVGAEVRRRQQTTVVRIPRWMPQSSLAAALALASVVVLSMTLGGAVVAAHYQAQDNQVRDQLAVNLQQRLSLARGKLEAASGQLALVEQRVARGMESSEAIGDAKAGVVEAQTQVAIIQSQLEEVRASGREPQDTISAPLVDGRDFVGDRLKIQLAVPRAAIDAAHAHLDLTQQRFKVGATANLDVITSRNRVMELEMALRTMQRKLEIRLQFVAGTVDAPMAELRVLEAEAQQRRDTIAPQIDLAHRQLSELQAKVAVGVAAPIDLKLAELHVYELELNLRKADLDLALVQKQIDQRKGK